ncbi:helix-hairpin-helix domain-containing protein [Synechocystis sp. LEGE 06083]|uniref:phospholipase D-like domain-containing protein n=1 Tax=Synechocystis sp. LEGE 06083 TaxID=915336 RepID=UPI00187FD847|nr:phospholipase D-like domain-containing protein [Synechocystis sp. LEGE 06083]MBE9194551.1 helix-hairpin-helix domain-containing protein [Synechocystis sp. LEGE 06083]
MGKLNRGWKQNPIVILVALALLVAIAIIGIGKVDPSGLGQSLARPDPLPQEQNIKVYFNLNNAKGADFIDPDRNFKRQGDNFEQIILDQINGAQSTIDLAIQELRLPRIAQALVRKQAAGVRVRLVLENIYNQTIQEAVEAEKDPFRYRGPLAYLDQNQDGRISPEESAERDAIEILRTQKIPLIDDTEDGSKGSGLMHHKFVVLDNKTVIVTSANFTPSDQYGDYDDHFTRGNANNLLVIQSPAVAHLFTEEFNLLWGDGPGEKKDSLFGINKPSRPAKALKVGETTVTVKFSPDRRTVPFAETSNGLIAQYLNQAQQKIQLALFVFSEQALSDVINQRFQAGTEIKALIDRGFAFRYYSEGLDLLGVKLLEDCLEQPGNRPWALPTEFVGTPALPRGDKLHHKFALVDDDTVITGSHNWSPAANHSNDETVLVLQNAQIGAHYQRELERLYAITEYGLPPTIQARIDRQEQECANPQPSPQPLAKATPNRLVNLNRGSQAELESLPGIGPSTAAKIITTRKQKPFTSLEDLGRVKGIGPSKIEGLQGKVTW